MDINQITSRVLKIVEEQLGVKPESTSKSLTDDLGADSLDTIELVMAIEEEFEIEIPDDDAETCKTVEDIINLVNRRIN